MSASKKLGNYGEAVVVRFLCDKGYSILAQNYSAKFGEIDIVAHKDEFVAFVEVKTRRVCYFPISTVVTRSKQQKIIKTAKLFILKSGITDMVFRFDVATVVCGDGGKSHVEYIENAFC